MDPEANLKEMLELAKDIEKMGDIGILDDITSTAERLAELLLAMHVWITNGGFLPKVWCAQRPQIAATLEGPVTPVFIKIPETTSLNYATLRRAIDESAVALLSCWDTKEKRSATLICAFGGEAEIEATPFAMMLNEHEIAYDRYVAPMSSQLHIDGRQGDLQEILSKAKEESDGRRKKGRPGKGSVGSGPAAVAKPVRKSADPRSKKVRGR